VLTYIRPLDGSGIIVNFRAQMRTAPGRLKENIEKRIYLGSEEKLSHNATPDDGISTRQIKEELWLDYRGCVCQAYLST